MGQKKNLDTKEKDVISNKDLFERCRTEPMATILIKRRGTWIGHVTCQEVSTAKTSLHWPPEGKHNFLGGASRSRGDRQWRKRSRRWGRPGKASNLWQGSGRCGVSMSMPYMPPIGVKAAAH